MKFIMSLMLTGIIALSCKKEQRTETTTNMDSIITDTMVADTVTTVTPVPAPVPSDTMRNADTATTQRKSTDTVKTTKK